MVDEDENLRRAVEPPPETPSPPERPDAEPPEDEPAPIEIPPGEPDEDGQQEPSPAEAERAPAPEVAAAPSWAGDVPPARSPR